MGGGEEGGGAAEREKREEGGRGGVVRTGVNGRTLSYNRYRLAMNQTNTQTYGIPTPLQLMKWRPCLTSPRTTNLKFGASEDQDMRQPPSNTGPNGKFVEEVTHRDRGTGKGKPTQTHDEWEAEEDPNIDKLEKIMSRTKEERREERHEEQLNRNPEQHHLGLVLHFLFFFFFLSTDEVQKEDRAASSQSEHSCRSCAQILRKRICTLRYWWFPFISLLNFKRKTLRMSRAPTICDCLTPTNEDHNL